MKKIILILSVLFILSVGNVYAICCCTEGYWDRTPTTELQCQSACHDKPNVQEMTCFEPEIDDSIYCDSAACTSSSSTIPEFSTYGIIAGIVIIGAAGLLIYKKKKVQEGEQ